MNRRRIIAIVAAFVVGLNLQVAYAIGEWCQPFIILKSFPSEPGVDSWIQNIQLQTRNAVDPEAQFRWNASATPTSIPDIVAQLKDGMAAMAVVDTSQFANVFPSLHALNYPGLVSDPANIASLYDGGKYFQYVEEEMHRLGMSVLAVSHIPYALVASREGMKSIDDLKGLKISSSSGFQAKFLSEIGALPVQTSYSRIFDEWKSGAIQGAIFPTHNIGSAGLEPLTKSVVISPTYDRNVLLIASDAFMHRASEDIVVAFEKIAEQTSLKYSGELLSKASAEITKLGMGGVAVTKLMAGENIGNTGLNTMELWKTYLQEYNQDVAGGVDAIVADLGG